MPKGRRRAHGSSRVGEVWWAALWDDPSESSRGAEECRHSRRRRRVVARTQRNERHRGTFSDLPKREAFRTSAHAPKQRSGSNSARPAQQRGPAFGVERTHDAPRTHACSHLTRREFERAKERERPRDRRRRVQLVLRHSLGRARDDRAAFLAVVAPQHQARDFGRRVGRCRSALLPLAHAMAVQHDPAAHAPARDATRRAIRRAHGVDRRRSVHPVLDLNRDPDEVVRALRLQVRSEQASGARPSKVHALLATLRALAASLLRLSPLSTPTSQVVHKLSVSPWTPSGSSVPARTPCLKRRSPPRDVRHGATADLISVFDGNGNDDHQAARAKITLLDLNSVRANSRAVRHGSSSRRLCDERLPRRPCRRIARYSSRCARAAQALGEEGYPVARVRLCVS